jgi:hypothetical protein
MTRSAITRLHRWIAIPIGVFILVWSISGIVMVAAPRLVPPAPQPSSGPLDLAGVGVSPAEAVASVEKRIGTTVSVQSLTLKRIGDVPVYSVSVEGKGLNLVDARTGQMFTMGPELAERIARRNVPAQAATRRVELVTERAPSYPWGPLPAYRVSFDGVGSDYYVSTEDGSVLRFDTRHMVVGLIESLHTFAPVRLLTEREGVRQGLLLLTSIVAVGLGITGYFLALPRRWTVRRVAAASERAPARGTL